ncbi:MAG: 3-methyl-2-oxobutanoate dehydrogenase subunit VorB [Deltaproteobacteria bacterium]|uniref:3-methyl-2-oxobutanoate dehydrogenase subunit VorB n=1 Tax=Candidatus Desulfacyla euxinica TaxID=2841693 RepID=A0A8J6MXX7_9DELT|nr:3-methyl-2-oxobutanoate dehydrogenase subunit VorB [Candidatus Desulfacyla euxinica]
MLMNGSQTVGEAAVRAGCRYYFGYPITPQNELPEYLSARMPEVGGTFIQGESEVASINMVLGASVAGARTMTSSSSPGISLKQEGISYMAGMELPAVIVNMMRGGPGLGNIAPSAADYFQATRGGAHGDYRTPVLAPAGGQELVDLTFEAFDLADKYRNPVMLLGDGLMGQVMEPVVFPDFIDLKDLPEKDWALRGCKGREARAIFSMILGQQGELYRHNLDLQKKYDRITAEEQRWETKYAEDAELIVVAYGTAARIAESAIEDLKAEGINAGLFRPISLWPFPLPALRELSKEIPKVAVFELCLGQMVEDVILSVGERAEIYFHGVPGGLIPTPAEVAEFLRSTVKGDGKVGRRMEV